MCLLYLHMSVNALLTWRIIQGTHWSIWHVGDDWSGPLKWLILNDRWLDHFMNGLLIELILTNMLCDHSKYIVWCYAMEWSMSDFFRHEEWKSGDTVVINTGMSPKNMGSDNRGGWWIPQSCVCGAEWNWMEGGKVTAGVDATDLYKRGVPWGIAWLGLFFGIVSHSIYPNWDCFSTLSRLSPGAEKAKNSVTKVM